MDMEAHCAGAGMHDGLGGEMGQHVATMESLADIAAARAEVERHALAMTSMIERHGQRDGIDDVRSLSDLA